MCTPPAPSVPVLGLDPRTGTEQWRVEPTDREQFSILADGGGGVCIGVGIQDWYWSERLRMVEVATGVIRKERDLPFKGASYVDALSVLVGESAVYVGAADTVYIEGAPESPYPQHALVALDAQTGTELWRASLPPNPAGGMTEHQGSLYVQSTSGVLHCLDAATGAEHWRYDLGSYYSYRVTDCLVYVPSRDGVLRAIDPATGEERWQYLENPPPNSWDDEVPPSVVVDGDTVYAAFNWLDPAEHDRYGTLYELMEQQDFPIPLVDTVITAVHAGTGIELWSAQPGGMINRIAKIDGLLLFQDGSSIVGVIESP